MNEKLAAHCCECVRLAQTVPLSQGIWLLQTLLDFVDAAPEAEPVRECFMRLREAERVCQLRFPPCKSN